MKHTLEVSGGLSNKKIKLYKDFQDILHSYESEVSDKQQNIKNLADLLIAMSLNDRSIFLNDDTIPDWKMIAVFNALKNNKIVKKIVVDLSNEISYECAEAFKELLIYNNTIKVLRYYSLTDLSNNRYIAICEGIEKNKSLKSLHINGYMNDGYASCLLKAVDKNKHIVKLELIGAFSIDLIFNKFLQNNKNLTTLSMLYDLEDVLDWTDEHSERMDESVDIEGMIEALKLNTSLQSFNVVYQDDDASNPTVSSSLLSKLKELMDTNHTLCKLPNFNYVPVNNEDTIMNIIEKKEKIEKLLIRNNENNENLINLTQTLDFTLTTPLSLQHRKALLGIEKISKNLLKQLLLKIDWSDQNFIHKYALLHEVNELKNYNVKKDFAKFTLEDRQAWSSKFEEFIKYYDDEQDSEVLKLIEKIQEYKDINFLSFHLICNKSATELDGFIWTKIASYLSFDDIKHTIIPVTPATDIVPLQGAHLESELE